MAELQKFQNQDNFQGGQKYCGDLPCVKMFGGNVLLFLSNSRGSDIHTDRQALTLDCIKFNRKHSVGE